MSTRKQTTESIAESIAGIYGLREAQQIARIVISELSGVPVTGLLTDPNAEIEVDGLDRIAAELASGRPMQYVLGHAEFCGMEFAVREGVLIPRPETEELVAWIAGKESGAASILDVGTGSGCIAISLKKALPDASLTGVDISDEALETAARNRTRLEADVTLIKADALGDMAAVVGGRFDVIVSNPPYIPQSDMAAMRLNVTGFEPHDALFVPDDDPLKFYRAIARAATEMLTPCGRLYFEIYELYGRQMEDMLAEEGFCLIETRKDINGKPRMLCCRKER